MKIVGDKLVELAQNEQRTNIENASLYAKTAYNRYYYSSFLFGRELLLSKGLISHDPKRKIGHGGKFGISLQGAAKPKIIKAIKNCTLTDTDKKLKINIINNTCNKISHYITFMYEARDAADYKKESKILFKKNDFNITFKKNNKDIIVEIGQMKQKNKDIEKLFSILSNICVEVGL